MAQQVLDHEFLARACPGQDGGEYELAEFEHSLSIADFRSREVCRPTAPRGPRASAAMRPARPRAGGDCHKTPAHPV